MLPELTSDDVMDLLKTTFAEAAVWSISSVTPLQDREGSPGFEVECRSAIEAHFWGRQLCSYSLVHEGTKYLIEPYRTFVPGETQ